jgi:hypothetical protein
MSLYAVLDDYLPSQVKNRKWKYGYDEKYDLVVISKDGTVGEVYEINGVKIGLPKVQKGLKKGENKWKPEEYPKELSRIKTIFEWNQMSPEFKVKWVDYIQAEFEKRDDGHWFVNNGSPTYITGSHYMYLQWSKIDIGLPDFRESNRIFWIFWEACKADDRCFGMCYLKNRRSGFSFMSSSETSNIGTISMDAKLGILSKTGPDAKEMFIHKVVPIVRNYPFFFKPVQDGMDAPKSELSFRLPAKKITKKNMAEKDEESITGLDTTIDWLSTADNSYDGQKLRMLVHDECYDPDTLILTEGMVFKKIKDINIGDRVIVEGGALKNVMKKTSGITDRYLVSQPYGEDYIVTENHRLVLNQYFASGHKEVIMTPKEYVESSSFKKKHLTRVTSKGIESNDIFKGIPPYLLGLWLGDGRSESFTIIVNTEEEPEILSYLGRISQFHNIPFKIIKPKCKKVIEFRFLGINDELRKLNVWKNKHIPDSYMQSSIETRLQILAGLIDTDGYSDKNKNCIEIGMNRKDLVHQIRTLALSCGISCSNVKHKKTNFNTDAWKISLSGELSRIPILTEKKSFNGYSPKTTGRRNKVDVSYIGKGDYIGIQVDGENDNERKLILSDFTVSLNSGKWLAPNNILNNWRVTKTCLRLGSRIVGKCMMGSTVNALAKGGQNFKDLYYDSDPKRRNNNGQTKSGLYSLFIPMDYNFEGFLDEYGHAVVEDPAKPVMGIDDRPINIGVVSYWSNEVEALKHDPDALNEFYRQYPRTESHAFRDESKQSLYNLTKIYQQIDHNDNLIRDRVITRGQFHWKGGVIDSEVVWTPDVRGRFIMAWVPPKELQNNVIVKNGKKYPGNADDGAFGCDPYDISGVVGGGGSNGALHGLTGSSMDPNIPSNMFFLEYIARPATAEIFFEDVLMACVFYGMPLLAENNKPRLLYHFKYRGYRGFSMNRPDRTIAQLSKTEIELGGIPNSSEDIRQTHAAGIESYIEQYVGFDNEGEYRNPDSIGNMYFNRTLEDWARFDPNNRTKHDASISSGLAIMGVRRHTFRVETKKSKISVSLSRYKNDGHSSQIIR